MKVVATVTNRPVDSLTDLSVSVTTVTNRSVDLLTDLSASVTPQNIINYKQQQINNRSVDVSQQISWCKSTDDDTTGCNRLETDLLI